MKKILATLTSAALAVSLAGCATVVHGTNQKETFKSLPSAAHIRVDGVSYGKTPAIVKLTRSDSHVVTLSLPGYKTAHIRLTKKMSGWFWGNLLLGGVIGFIVDAADGSMYVLEPAPGVHNVTSGKKNTLTIVLERKGQHLRRGRKIGQLKKIK